MTKVLDVLTGSYIKHISYRKYDRLHPEFYFAKVECWEESYDYIIGESLQELVNRWNKQAKAERYVIIYD